MVKKFKVSGVMVVMVVDSANVGMGLGIVTKMDGIYVMIVSKTLEGLGGGVVMVPKGMYGGEEGCRGIDEVEIIKLA